MGCTCETRKDFAAFSDVLTDFKAESGQVIPLLQRAQEMYGYVSPEVIKIISDYTKSSEAQIYGVATFYAQFRLTPVGEHIIRICHGTACHVANVKTVHIALEEELGIHDGETTPDGKFTFEKVSCLGCCSLAPVMMIDEDTHGRLTPESAVKILRSY